MAYIKKSGARKELVRDIPTIGVKNVRDEFTIGLRFEIQIGPYKVSLTHMERDIVVEQWNRFEKEHEQ